MDAQYLRDTVGGVLARGVAAVQFHQPADPVEFLARWLLKEKANELREREVRLRRCRARSGDGG